MTMIAEIAGLSGILLASAGGACPAVPGPQVTVDVRRQGTTVQHDMTKEQLQAIKADTDLPYLMQNMAHVETGGMMRGDIRVLYNVDLEDVSGAGDPCVRYETIRVTLELAPTIMIASEYAPDSCWYHQIREHEESHIDMDALVIEKYRQRIQDGLTLAFSEPQDFIGGPVPDRFVPDLKETMGRNVVKIVDVLVRDMSRDRAQRQQAVDSLQNYRYIMDQCYKGDNVYRPE